MLPRRSVSFPSYIEEAAAAATGDAARARRLARVALVAWAAAVYVAYWLGQIGAGAR